MSDQDEQNIVDAEVPPPAEQPKPAAAPAAPGVSVVKAPERPMEMGERGAQVKDSKDLWSLAKIMAHGMGKVDPNAADHVKQLAYYGCAIQIQAGAEVGLSPIMSMRALYPVNGRLAWMLEGLTAVMRNRGIIPANDPDAWSYHFVNLPEEGTELKDWPNSAACIVRLRRTSWDTHKEYRYSVGDARLGGHWMKTTRGGGNTAWMTDPKRMLMARAGSFLIRDYCSDVTLGLPIVEEARDMPKLKSGGVASVTPEDDEPVEAGPEPPDPLLVEMGIVDAPPATAAPIPTVATVAPAPAPEPPAQQTIADLKAEVKKIENRTRPGCDHPQEKWKEQGAVIVCSACGEEIGPAH